MKAHLKLTVGIAVATITVLVASQSVNQAAVDQKVRVEKVKKVGYQLFYTNDEVELLMRANHWTRQKAIQILELSSRPVAAPER
jgi:hypothetical protein